MTVYQVLELIEKTPGHLDKQKILKENESDELKYLLKLAFDPYILFGVKEFTTKVDSSLISNPFSVVKILAESLIKGEIIGNKAKEKLELIISGPEPLEVKYLTAIFKKNLTIGLATKSINEVFPKLISTFEIALCKVLQSNVKEENTKTKKIYDVNLLEMDTLLRNEDWYIEPKLDGLRCVIFVDSQGNCEFLTRNGNPIYNLEHVADEIKKLGFTNMVFEGEAKAMDWSQSVSIARSEKNIVGKNTKALKYNIFDALTLDEWNTKKTINYLERKKRIIDGEHITKVLNFKVRTLAEAQGLYEVFLTNGYEGAILKRNDGYSFKRDKNWLKWKPYYSEDLLIIGYEEGEGKNKGRLGKFFVNFKGVKVGVGGGYGEKEPNNERQNFWDNREKMIGKIIEVKHYGVTKDGSLKHPQYLRLREDK